MQYRERRQMKRVIKFLEEEKKYYYNIAKMAKKEIDSTSIESRLRVSYRNGVPQYYEITRIGDTNGTYLPKREISKIRAIAQSDYEKKVYKCATKFSSTIQIFMKNIPNEEIINHYFM